MARYQTTQPGYILQTQTRQIKRDRFEARVILVYEDPDMGSPRGTMAETIYLRICGTRGQAHYDAEKRTQELLARPDLIQKEIEEGISEIEASYERGRCMDTNQTFDLVGMQL